MVTTTRSVSASPSLPPTNTHDSSPQLSLGASKGRMCRWSRGYLGCEDSKPVSQASAPTATPTPSVVEEIAHSQLSDPSPSTTSQLATDSTLPLEGRNVQQIDGSNVPHGEFNTADTTTASPSTTSQPQGCFESSFAEADATIPGTDEAPLAGNISSDVGQCSIWERLKNNQSNDTSSAAGDTAFLAGEPGADNGYCTASNNTVSQNVFGPQNLITVDGSGMNWRQQGTGPYSAVNIGDASVQDDTDIGLKPNISDTAAKASRFAGVLSRVSDVVSSCWQITQTPLGNMVRGPIRYIPNLARAAVPASILASATIIATSGYGAVYFGKQVYKSYTVSKSPGSILNWPGVKKPLACAVGCTFICAYELSRVGRQVLTGTYFVS